MLRTPRVCRRIVQTRAKSTYFRRLDTPGAPGVKTVSSSFSTTAVTSMPEIPGPVLLGGVSFFMYGLDRPIHIWKLSE